MKNQLLSMLLLLLFSISQAQEVVYFDKALGKEIEKIKALDTTLYKIGKTKVDTSYNRTHTKNFKTSGQALKSWPPGQDIKKRYYAQIEVVFKRNTFHFDFDTLDKRQVAHNIHSISSSSMRISTLRDTFVMSGGASLLGTISNVSNRGNCDYTATILQIIDTVYVKSLITSIPELNKKEESILFPNPAQGYLILSPPRIEYNDQVEIINVQGKSVYKTVEQKKIDISDLPRGIYFLRYKDAIQKFIKQ